MLDSQLSKRSVARTTDVGAVWKRELRSQLLQHHDDSVNGLPSPFVETLPPFAELVRGLDAPRQYSLQICYQLHMLSNTCSACCGGSRSRLAFESQRGLNRDDQTVRRERGFLSPWDEEWAFGRPYHTSQQRTAALSAWLCCWFSMHLATDERVPDEGTRRAVSRTSLPVQTRTRVSSQRPYAGGWIVPVLNVVSPSRVVVVLTRRRATRVV